MFYRNVLISALAITSFAPLRAQYTETLNSNRPGISQGAFAVGKNILQLEGGFGYGKENHSLLSTATTGITIDYAVRYGLLLEELEISIIGEFQSNKVTDTRATIPFEYNQANFRNNTIGLKYLFYDPYPARELKGPNLYSWKANHRFQWDDLIPAISIYAGANIDFMDNPFTPEAESSINPKFVLATQNNWLGGWVFVTNIIVDRVTTQFPTYSYILTLTHAFNPKFSVFGETQGIKSDFYADQLFRAGGAYLFNTEFQVDASVLFNIKDTPTRTYGRLGLSYRFDFHKEDEYIQEKGKSGRDKRDKAREDKKNKQKRQDQIDVKDDGDGGLKL